MILESPNSILFPLLTVVPSYYIGFLLVCQTLFLLNLWLVREKDQAAPGMGHLTEEKSPVLFAKARTYPVVNPWQEDFLPEEEAGYGYDLSGHWNANRRKCLYRCGWPGA